MLKELYSCCRIDVLYFPQKSCVLFRGAFRTSSTRVSSKYELRSARLISKNDCEVHQNTYSQAAIRISLGHPNAPPSGKRSVALHGDEGFDTLQRVDWIYSHIPLDPIAVGDPGLTQTKSNAERKMAYLAHASSKRSVCPCFSYSRHSAEYCSDPTKVASTSSRIISFGSLMSVYSSRVFPDFEYIFARTVSTT